MIGRIHSFQSLGTVDGPGVRCVVFMQGCPLRCICCHNPDTWNPADGVETDTETLVRRILRCRNYFGKEGGVTVSGGEPLLQAAFVGELFTELKKAGIHTALDTSGCLWNKDTEALLAVTDLVLLDHKYADEEGYRMNTGCELVRVERFLDELEARNLPTWIRRVIIPGFNDDAVSTLALRNIAACHSCVKKIELLPFRKLCLEKYEALNISFPLKSTPEPDDALMERLNSLLTVGLPDKAICVAPDSALHE